MFFSDLQSAINVAKNAVQYSIVVRVTDTYGDVEYSVMTRDEYIYVLPMLNNKSEIAEHKIVFKKRDSLLNKDE